MKKVNLLTILLVTTVILAIMVMPAMAVPTSIDGDLSDWGISDADIQKGLSDSAHDASQIGDEVSWIPSGSTVRWVVEDNVDPDSTSWDPDYYGVHIIGLGGAYSIYDEPLATHVNGYQVLQPYDGEKWDVEAMYIDEDNDYVYVGIVASKDADWDLGRNIADLALNVDGLSSTGEYGFEYGVDISAEEVWQVTDWKDSNYLVSVPTLVNTGSKTGDAEIGLDMVDIGGANVLEKNDQEIPTDNFIIEIKIDKADIGVPSGTTLDLRPGRIHYTSPCGNDPVIPEFLTVGIPIGMLLGLFYVLRRKRRSQ
jgi:hypothetical protein